MIYTVTMNPAIDCAMTAEKLTAGEVNRALSQDIRFGGKGINVSYVLQKFGGDSILTGFCAGFTGDTLTAGLTAEGFTCDFVTLSQGNTRINVKLTLQNTEGDPDTEFNASGPSPNDSELSRLKDILSRTTPDDAVVIAGSLPRGVCTAYITEIANALPHGASFICDLSGDALRHALKASPDFVKPNIHELFDLLGIPRTAENLGNRRLIERSAAVLTEMGAASVLITMGKDGAYYISRECAGFIPSPPVPADAAQERSAVGCGDSAVAGWLIGMGYAGNSVRSRAMDAAGIDPNDPMAEAKLAVIIGSGSYYFGFPASPEKIRNFLNTERI